jgi:muconate cycloisomerase
MSTIIERVDVIPIRAPRKESVRSGLNPGDPVSASEFGIIRIVTAHLEGLGEISITFPRIGHSLCHAARKLVAPALIGRDALAAPPILAEIERILGHEMSWPYIRCGFEMALLDLAGKHYGIPVYQLLGGKMRDRAGLAWGIYQKPPEEMARDAAAGKAAGFQAIKLKVGRKLEDDLAAVKAVTAAVGPQTPLRLDANMAWRSVPEAAAAMRAFAGAAPIAWVEQPLGRRNLEGMRALRGSTGLPVMADESLQTLRDAYELARAEAADIWNVYVAEAGGVRAAAEIFALAASLDIPCILGSQAEMGIGTAACAHLAVSVAQLPHAIETFGPLRYEKDIVKTPVPIENGWLSPPPGPGLGVELDRDAVKEMEVQLA